MVDTLDDSRRSDAQLREQNESLRVILDTITHAESLFLKEKEKANLSHIFDELLQAALAATKAKEGFLIDLNLERGLLASTPDFPEEELFAFLKGTVPSSLKNSAAHIERAVNEMQPLFVSEHALFPLIKDNKTVGLLLLKKELTEESLQLILPLLQVTITLMESFEREKRRKEAEELAEKAHLAKSAFLANMSHEMKTPLNVIIGMADLLKGTELSDTQKKFVSRLCDSSQELLSFVNRLLDLSSLESGTVTIEKATFLLEELIEAVSSHFKPLAEKKGLTLNIRGLKKRCIGDPVRLKELLGHLLSNAIKFTDQGSVNLTLEERGDLLYFEVSDTGIGISEDKQREIFIPFVQNDSSSTRKHGGAGLGLSIAAHLVKSMGGEIHLSSRVGNGSHFSFEIPL